MLFKTLNINKPAGYNIFDDLLFRTDTDRAAVYYNHLGITNE
jgi:hypothetical protein